MRTSLITRTTRPTLAPTRAVLLPRALSASSGLSSLVPHMYSATGVRSRKSVAVDSTSRPKKKPGK